MSDAFVGLPGPNWSQMSHRYLP